MFDVLWLVRFGFGTCMARLTGRTEDYKRLFVKVQTELAIHSKLAHFGRAVSVKRLLARRLHANAWGVHMHGKLLHHTHSL